MLTYFLQEYLTGTPSCFTATLKGDPALKSFFFPLYERIVMVRLVRTFEGVVYIDGTIPKALAVWMTYAHSPISKNNRIFCLLSNFLITILYLCAFWVTKVGPAIRLVFRSESLLVDRFYCPSWIMVTTVVCVSQSMENLVDLDRHCEKVSPVALDKWRHIGSMPVPDTRIKICSWIFGVRPHGPFHSL